MKNAVQDFLFQIVCTVIFVLSSIIMITEFTNAQSVVKQFGKQMGIHEELQLHDGDSEDWDTWNGSQWVHTQLKVNSQDILNEILANDSNISFYIDNIAIPQSEINLAKNKHDSSVILAYLANRTYQKIYEYSDNGKIIAIHFK